MKKYISFGAIVLVVIGLIYGVVYIADGKKAPAQKQYPITKTFVLFYLINVFLAMAPMQIK